MRLEGCGTPVRFDDRLLTVLSQPAGDRHDAAVRWRQLVDLVARAGPTAPSPLVDQALEAIRTDAPRSTRACAPRQRARSRRLPLPLGLLEYFASDSLAVSAPVLAAATLEPAQWQALARRRRRRDPAVHRDAPSRNLPAATAARSEPARTAQSNRCGADERRRSSRQLPRFSDVVARIERRRRSRGCTRCAGGRQSRGRQRRRCSAGNAGPAATSPGSTAPRAARDRPLDRPRRGTATATLDDDVVRAFAMRAPFRDAELMPRRRRPGRRAMEDQRRAGVRARRRPLRRLSRDRAARSAAPSTAPSDASDVARRPGFAARAGPRDQDAAQRDHRFRRDHRRPVSRPGRPPLPRARRRDRRPGAAAAVGDRRSRFRRQGPFADASGPAAGRSRRAARADGRPLREVASAARRRARASSTPARRRRARSSRSSPTGCSSGFCTALFERAETGERLRLSRRADRRSLPLSICRPRALRASATSDLFGGGSGRGRSSGFSLRLVRGLARIAGGDLALGADGITLLFRRA